MTVTANAKQLNLAATLSLTTLITRSRMAHKTEQSESIQSEPEQLKLEEQIVEQPEPEQVPEPEQFVEPEQIAEPEEFVKPDQIAEPEQVADTLDEPIQA